jgi:hypothetical protein
VNQRPGPGPNAPRGATWYQGRLGRRGLHAFRTRSDLLPGPTVACSRAIAEIAAWRHPHAGLKLGIRQDTLKTLDHVQIADPCGNQRSFAAAQQRRDGTLGAEQRLPQLGVATKLNHDVSESVEVLRHRIGHDVAVFRSPHNTPRSQRQATDDNKANIRLDDANEKLIERRGTQRARRAESRNSNSLRVSEIVSLRFTTSGRCPSARRRERLTRSPSRSWYRCLVRSSINANTIEPFAGDPGEEGSLQGIVGSPSDGETGTTCELSCPG